MTRCTSEVQATQRESLNPTCAQQYPTSLQYVSYLPLRFASQHANALRGEAARWRDSTRRKTRSSCEDNFRRSEMKCVLLSNKLGPRPAQNKTTPDPARNKVVMQPTVFCQDAQARVMISALHCAQLARNPRRRGLSRNVEHTEKRANALQEKRLGTNMRAKKKMCYAIESACVQTRGGCTTECHKTAAINETSPAENGKAREGA